MSSSQQRRWDFEATSADDGGRGGGDEQVQQARPYGGMSLINNEVNMTNCYNQCEHFFRRIKSIHFKVLISYWMMAGYLGDRFRSVEEAFNKGVDILIELVYKEKILGHDGGMIQFQGSNATCRHRGFCISVSDYRARLSFVHVSFSELCKIGKVVLSKDEMLIMDSNVLVLKEFRVTEDQENKKYFAAFNPTPDSLKALLENVKNPSVLLLRGFDELSLQSDCFPLNRLHTLTILEISGSSRLTTIPENTISQLIHLEYLNLSHLPIEEFPRSFFKYIKRLCWLILRWCCKLLTLELSYYADCLTVLDLSHCTALQSLALSFYHPLTGSL